MYNFAGDGTVVEQTVTPSELCDQKDIKMFELGIARKYRVGDGNLKANFALNYT